MSELCSGPCVAMAVTHRDGSCVEQFRQLVGPMDPVSISIHLLPTVVRSVCTCVCVCSRVRVRVRVRVCVCVRASV